MALARAMSTLIVAEEQRGQRAVAVGAARGGVGDRIDLPVVEDLVVNGDGAAHVALLLFG